MHISLHQPISSSCCGRLPANNKALVISSSSSTASAFPPPSPCIRESQQQDLSFQCLPSLHAQQQRPEAGRCGAFPLPLLHLTFSPIEHTLPPTRSIALSLYLG